MRQPIQILVYAPDVVEMREHVFLTYIEGWATPRIGPREHDA